MAVVLLGWLLSLTAESADYVQLLGPRGHFAFYGTISTLLFAVAGAIWWLRDGDSGRSVGFRVTRAALLITLWLTCSVMYGTSAGARFPTVHFLMFKPIPVIVPVQPWGGRVPPQMASAHGWAFQVRVRSSAWPLDAYTASFQSD